MTTAARTSAPAQPEPYDGLRAAATAQRPSRISAVSQWVLLFVVFAVALELTCRVEDWVTYRMPLLSPYSSLNDLVIRDADGMHGRPNAQFQKWSMNSLGMRAQETPLVPPAGTTRVFTVGASETFGLRESPGREYPRQLEDSLNARVARSECASGTTIRFQVLNAAFAGMSLPTIDQDVHNRLRRLHPDLVFAYPSPAQYLEDEPPVAAPPDSTERPAAPTRLRAMRPRAIARTREQLKLLLPEWLQARIRGYQRRKDVETHPTAWQFRSVPQDRLALFESDLRKLVGTIRSVGAEPILSTHANLFMSGKKDANMLVAWEKFYPRATGKTIIAFDSVARAVTMRVAADSGVVIVDAATRLAAAPASAFADFVHFTDLGASHMADVASQGVIAAARKTARCRPADK